MALFLTFTTNFKKEHRKVQNVVNRYVSVHNGKEVGDRQKNLIAFKGNLRIVLDAHFPGKYHLVHNSDECKIDVRIEALYGSAYAYETIISISDVCQ